MAQTAGGTVRRCGSREDTSEGAQTRKSASCYDEPTAPTEAILYRFRPGHLSNEGDYMMFMGRSCYEIGNDIPVPISEKKVKNLGRSL